MDSGAGTEAYGVTEKFIFIVLKNINVKIRDFEVITEFAKKHYFR